MATTLNGKPIRTRGGKHTPGAGASWRKDVERTAATLAPKDSPTEVFGREWIWWDTSGSDVPALETERDFDNGAVSPLNGSPCLRQSTGDRQFMRADEITETEPLREFQYTKQGDRVEVSSNSRVSYRRGKTLLRQGRPDTFGEALDRNGVEIGTPFKVQEGKGKNRRIVTRWEAKHVVIETSPTDAGRVDIDLFDHLPDQRRPTPLDYKPPTPAGPGIAIDIKIDTSNRSSFPAKLIEEIEARGNAPKPVSPIAPQK